MSSRFKATGSFAGLTTNFATDGTENAENILIADYVGCADFLISFFCSPRRHEGHEEKIERWYFVRRRRSKHLQLWEDTIYKRFPKLAIVLLSCCICIAKNFYDKNNDFQT